MISHYGAAVYLYYDEDLKEVYEKCSCRNGNPFEFEIQNEEDLREVSKTIAELNTVISDQWNYTPGLELTDPDILAIRVTVDVMKDGSAKRTSYTLNGYDKEDEVYSQLKTEW
ncbi:MAG: hypothetical protein J6N70_15935 [Oribacterium sp.]|nr:hypothetical protein [Oribacterium sp.]